MNDMYRVSVYKTALIAVTLFGGCSSNWVSVRESTDDIREIYLVYFGHAYLDNFECKLGPSRTSMCSDKQTEYLIKTETGEVVAKKCDDLDKIPQCGLDAIKAALKKNNQCINGFYVVNRMADVRGDIKGFKIACK